MAAVTSHDDAAAIEGLQRELDALVAENVSLVERLKEAKAEAKQHADYSEQEARQVEELAAALDQAEAKVRVRRKSLSILLTMLYFFGMCIKCLVLI